MVHATRHRLARRFLHVLAAAAAVSALLTPSAALADGEKKAVYTITNAASGNAVLAFHRAANGALTPAGTFPTGGTGTGGGSRLRPLTRGLQGWQSARRRERRQQHGFGLQGRSRRLRLIGSPVGSGGARPTSLTVDDDLVYVMNADSNSIAGFRLDDKRCRRSSRRGRPRPHLAVERGRAIRLRRRSAWKYPVLRQLCAAG